MEMRAREFIGIGQDLSAPIAPYSAALHHAAILSHCSSCFQSLQNEPTASCVGCSSMAVYCSSNCLNSDIGRHISSGECCFFQLSKKSPFNNLVSSSTDIRVALRLLHYFEVRGVFRNFKSGAPAAPERLGGLHSGGLSLVIEDGGELCDRIKASSLLMAQARGRNAKQEEMTFRGGITVDAVALWTVITNAVEVQLTDGGGSLGVAVYGKNYSYFNHSCLPSACYRFEMAADCQDSTHDSNTLVFPARSDLESEGEVTLNFSSSDTELCTNGPRVVVRSIKLIRKHQEVCVSYIDLLQTKEARQSDLWSKYRFICRCERCSASPEMFIDRALRCDAGELNTGEKCNIPPSEFDDLGEALELAVQEYTSNDDPETCCRMLESLLLLHSLGTAAQDGDLQGRRRIILHPLHHVSLSAYMTLASANRTLSSLEDGDHEISCHRRLAAAYSLLLAGATHNLFLADSSFITATSHFWINAGETVLHLVRNEPSLRKTQGSVTTEHQLMKCFTDTAVQCWPFLIRGSSYLQTIKNPIQFSSVRAAAITMSTSKTDTSLAGEMNRLCRLGIHSLSYGKHLASICYGPQSYLVRHADALLSESAG